MNLTANVGAIADALTLATPLSSDDKYAKKIAALEAVRITTADGAAVISANILDYAIAITLPVAIKEAGAVAVSSAKLAALAASFASTNTIEIATDEKVARVDCGRSHFKLPMFPLGDLPPAPELIEEAGRVELEREQALRLFKRPAFAVSTEDKCYYLGGIFLHDTDDGLAAVATDGHRLARAVVPGAGGLSDDHRLIVPRSPVKIITKLLADKSITRVTLRRSKTLIAIETATAIFTSKLVDATFPDYARIIPKPSENTVVINCAELACALERVAAVSEGRLPIVGLAWAEGEPILSLCSPGCDAADDTIAAEVTGNGRVAIQIGMLAELLEAHPGKRIRFDNRNGTDPILVSDPDDENFTALQMPCRWGAGGGGIGETSI